jgi:hypothetical protein
MVYRRRSCVSCYSICMAVFGLGPPRVRDASSCQQLQCERGLTHDGSSIAIEITVLIYNIAQAPFLPLSFRLALIPSHAISCRLMRQTSLRATTYKTLHCPWKTWWINVPSKSILHRFISPARKYNDEKTTRGFLHWTYGPGCGHLASTSFEQRTKHTWAFTEDVDPKGLMLTYFE